MAAPKRYGNVLSEFAVEIIVPASAAMCYALWMDTEAVKSFVPGLQHAKWTPDGRCVEAGAHTRSLLSST